MVQPLKLLAIVGEVGIEVGVGGLRRTGPTGEQQKERQQGGAMGWHGSNVNRARTGVNEVRALSCSSSRAWRGTCSNDLVGRACYREHAGKVPRYARDEDR